FVLMLEAQRRGHRLHYAHPRDLYLSGSTPGVKAGPVTVERVRGAHFELGRAADHELDEFDAIFMRKDPPFDIEYYLSTLVLERVDRGRVVLLNDPRGLREFNEKMSALLWPHLMAPTLITADRERIKDFIRQHGRSVIKPLVNAGGDGILLLEKDDRNTRSAIDLLTFRGTRMIEVQAYIEAVEQGDKRIILIDGRAAGAINRVPSKTDIAANMHVGGRAERSELTERDRQICEELGPILVEHGLILVGLDVIGGFLTEVNVTSPTGLQEIARFDGVHLEEAVLDTVERKVEAARNG
ncbi:MAG: glutathione synthase, partial [Myxococcales bacterium]|nr:glutathione synthase [Myxococcales bacterium]